MSDRPLDDINLAIIQMLQVGRRSYSEIASVLNVSEATVRLRVAKMSKDGTLKIQATVSRKHMPDGYSLVYVGVRLNTPILMDTANEFSKIPGVISVAVVTGRYDMILTVMLKPGYKLIDFYNEMLSKHSTTIKSNETFVVYEDINLSLPFPF